MPAPSPVFAAALFSGFIFASCWSEQTKKRLCKEFEYSGGLKPNVLRFSSSSCVQSP